MKTYEFRYRTGENKYEYRVYKGSVTANSLSEAVFRAETRTMRRAGAELIEVVLADSTL